MVLQYRQVCVVVEQAIVIVVAASSDPIEYNLRASGIYSV